jgi:hypothetical protein
MEKMEQSLLSRNQLFKDIIRQGKVASETLQKPRPN